MFGPHWVIQTVGRLKVTPVLHMQSHALSRDTAICSGLQEKVQIQVTGNCRGGALRQSTHTERAFVGGACNASAPMPAFEHLMFCKDLTWHILDVNIHEGVLPRV